MLNAKELSSVELKVTHFLIQHNFFHVSSDIIFYDTVTISGFETTQIAKLQIKAAEPQWNGVNSFMSP